MCVMCLMGSGGWGARHLHETTTTFVDSRWGGLYECSWGEDEVLIHVNGAELELICTVLDLIWPACRPPPPEEGGYIQMRD